MMKSWSHALALGGLALGAAQLACSEDPSEQVGDAATSASDTPTTSNGAGAAAASSDASSDTAQTGTTGAGSGTTGGTVGQDDESGSESTGALQDPQPPHGRVVIDEVCFTGAEPFGEVDHYFSDQFIALRNVSDAPVAIGGLMIGDVFGVAGAINPGTEPNAIADDPEHVYVSSLWRIPGAPLDVTLEPGARLVVAQDGTNHGPFSSLDLSGADFETYVADSGQDDDYPTVDNLELLHDNTGFDWLIPVFGPSVVILDTTEFLATHDHEGWTLVEVPVSAVVDGVDIVMDAGSGAFKRLPPTVDAGFTFASGTYTGESVRRRREDGSSVDTDDSSVDFELTPTPEPYF